MLAILRLLLAIMALLGFYVPGGRLYRCTDRRSPTYGPQGCEVIRLDPPGTTYGFRRPLR